MAVRRAMGASAGRIARVQVVESLMLATAGAVVGLALARVIGGLYEGESLWGLPGFEGLELDRSALAFAAVAVAVTTLLFGVVPALLAGRFELAVHMRGSSGRATGGHGGLRSGMSALQIALSLPLLVASLLLIRTLREIGSAELGLDPEGVQVSTVAVLRLGPEGPPFDPLHRGILSAVQEVPGVAQAALAGVGPYAMRRPRATIAEPGREDADALVAEVRWASPGWFELVRMEPVAGRTFRERDWSSTGPPAVIVTAPLARRLFGGVDVVGRTVRVGIRDLVDAEIVGVVGEVRVGDPRSPPDELFFLSYPPTWLRSELTVHVRTSEPAPAVLDGVLAAMERAVPDLPVARATPLSARIDTQLTEQRLFARLLSLLSVLAVVVSAVGVYGVVAYAAASRTREFGIRMALGADGRRITAHALDSAVATVAVGAALGLAGAYALARLIRSRLVGVEPLDAASYATALALLAAVTVTAVWLPAAGASRVDPAATLRPE